MMPVIFGYRPWTLVNECRYSRPLQHYYFQRVNNKNENKDKTLIVFSFCFPHQA